MAATAIAKKQRPPARGRHAARIRWARQLGRDVALVVQRHAGIDPEDVRLTLIALQQPPLERLNRSLRRGRGFAHFRS